jgi:dethiobiotin synthetase
MLTRALLATLSVVLVAGCNGGTVDQHALTNDAATIDSLACEGALLARDVAAGKTTAFFAREQAEELGIEAANLADALADRKTLPSIEQKVRAKSKDAARLAATLQRLHDHPSDKDVATSVERQLTRLGGCE